MWTVSATPVLLLVAGSGQLGYASKYRRCTSVAKLCHRVRHPRSTRRRPSVDAKFYTAEDAVSVNQNLGSDFLLWLDGASDHVDKGLFV